MKNIIDIRKEPIINKKWNFESTLKDFPEGILITGPNSFIGVHIIEYLQRNYKIPLHLLIRAENENSAIKKMESSYQKWGLGNFTNNDIRFYLGNVCDENFGLSDADFQNLTDQTGTVIHLAMNPLYHLPYDFFRKNWLPELEKMIEFCGNHHNPKSLHYSSSFNAAFFKTENDFASVNSNAWQSGYAAFKWVATKAILNAFSQNMKGCLYDIPLVVGSLDKGLCPDNYSIWQILNIFLSTGFYFPFSFRIIPVNVLSECICLNILNEKNGKGIQLCRPVFNEPVTETMFEKTAQMLGLQKAEKEEVRNLFTKKLRFDFMIPPSFYRLIEILNTMEAIFPVNFETNKLHSTKNVFNVNVSEFLREKLQQLNFKPIANADKS